jgi:hypothetical protein
MLRLQALELKSPSKCREWVRQFGRNLRRQSGPVVVVGMKAESCAIFTVDGVFYLAQEDLKLLTVLARIYATACIRGALYDVLFGGAFSPDMAEIRKLDLISRIAELSSNQEFRCVLDADIQHLPTARC